MSYYTKHVGVYQYMGTVIYRDGVEIARYDNGDDLGWDTRSVEEITEEEAEGYL